MYMMKRALFILLLCALAATARGAEETDSLLKACQENFERFGRMFPQERVYVHFDNTSYYKGEQIWYKAYVVRDDNLSPTDLSRILYVELLNPIGYPIETQKLPIVDGQAAGSFLLKDTLNAGFYEVRAYTTWMLNFTTGDEHGWQRLRMRDARRHYGERLQRYLQGNAGVFSRVMPIYEKVDSGQYSRRRMPRLPKATATLPEPVKDKLQIDFYPEGGNLIRGVPTRIAFQAHNAEGRTLNVSGTLVRRGKAIGYFKTDYAGRGVFSVTPDSLDAEELTQGLELKLTYQHKDYSFALPRPKKRGYSLSVFSSDRQLRALIARNEHTEGQRLGLSVTSRGRTCYYNVADLSSEKEVTVRIDKKTLKTGVNVVTLFTAQGKVLAQRMVFVDNHDADGYRLKPTGQDWAADSLEPYARVTLDYQLVDNAGRPVRAAHNFSIAVTDRKSRELTYDDGNVLSYLLLASEVKGFIPHPEYYFDTTDRSPQAQNERQAALDMLLMVQGWTRYDYEQMMSNEPFEPMLPVEKGLTFAGRIWDDHDYNSQKFWKLQTKKPHWVYSELYIKGDTLSKGCLSGDSLPRPQVSYTSELSREEEFAESLRFKGIILTGETKVDSTGTFSLNMQPFYGKGRMALVLNKESIETLGLDKGGIHGHNFRWNTVRRPKFLLGKRIEPLNQYSPLPKNYDYYETAALTDPIDRDMFRYGFMAVPKENDRLIYYDAVTKSLILPEVLKKKHRRWSDFRQVSPVSVMDVKDLMAWLSNIYGDISDFKFRENNPYAGADGNTKSEHEDFVHNMMMEDARWMDEQVGPNSRTYQTLMMRTIHQEQEYASQDFDNPPYYARLAEMLYIFGLDGMNKIYVGADSIHGTPHYTTATGTIEALPHNMHFFPVNENFKDLRLYADIDNRRLTHQPGRYHEVVFNYEQERATGNDHPLTSIFNFTTVNTYANTTPEPEFLGYRINFQGFTLPTEFYHPNYDWEPEPEETDYRRTVYWNPMMKTDEEGKAKVVFFNNGFSSHLTVSAEGITTDGKVICTPIVQQLPDDAER